MERNALAAETGLNIGHVAVEISVFPIHLVDDDDAGQAGRLAHIPGALRANVHARRRGYQDGGAFHHPQGADHFALKVVIARGVQEIHLAAIGDGGDQGGLDTAAALDFLGFVVGYGIAVLNPALAGDRPGAKERRFAKGGLAGAGMGKQGHVSKAAGIHTGLAPSS